VSSIQQQIKLDMESAALPQRHDRARVRLGRAARGATLAPALDRVFITAFAVGLGWAPFWLGGAWRLSWGVNALLFPGLALTWEISRLVARRAPPLPAREIAISFGLFLIALLWIVAQMVPWEIAPSVAALGDKAPATISLDPGATAIAAVRLITDACAFWLAAQLGRDANASLALLRVVAAIVTLYCAYGLFLSAAYDNAIPGFAPADGGGEVRSTFINRNSFAVFAGLGLLTILGLATRRLSSDGLAPRFARWLERLGLRGGLIATGLVVVAALLGSASRGGILSCVVGVVALFGLLAERRRQRGEAKISLLPAALALGLAFVAFSAPLATRLADAGLIDARRVEVYRIVGRAILERPFAGFGYGAFAETFPLYRDVTLSPVGVWEMAHNAYLELVLGLGLVAGAALIAALGLIARRCFLGALSRNRDPEASLIATSACALIGANALVDYSVQIEGVTLTFMTLLGLGVAQRPRAGGGARC
jgi:O-antigen ligase